MTGSRSKLLPIQGKWSKERKPKTKSKTRGNKNPKTILHPQTHSNQVAPVSHTKARFEVFYFTGFNGYPFPLSRPKSCHYKSPMEFILCIPKIVSATLVKRINSWQWRERETVNLIKITMDQILTVNWMGKLKSQWTLIKITMDTINWMGREWINSVLFDRIWAGDRWRGPGRQLCPPGSNVGWIGWALLWALKTTSFWASRCSLSHISYGYTLPKCAYT